MYRANQQNQSEVKVQIPTEVIQFILAHRRRRLARIKQQNILNDKTLSDAQLNKRVAKQPDENG